MERGQRRGRALQALARALRGRSLCGFSCGGAPRCPPACVRPMTSTATSPAAARSERPSAWASGSHTVNRRGRVCLNSERLAGGQIRGGSPQRHPLGATEPVSLPAELRAVPAALSFSSSTLLPSLAESTPVADQVTNAPTPADLERVEKFTRETFVAENEEAAVALAPGSPRRVAFDYALGRARRRPEAALGRVAPPVLAAARARAAARRGGAAPGRRHRAVRPPGRRAVRHADRAARRGPAQRQRAHQRRGRRRRRRRARPRRDPRRGGATRRKRTRSPWTGAPSPARTTTTSSRSSPRTPTPPSASGSSTRRAPARRSPRSASSRPRAPAAC